MDADKPIKPVTRINPAQEAFDRNEAAFAARRVRKIAENDALSRTQPDHSEKAKTMWQGEGGSTADEQPKRLPKPSGSWTPWGTQ